MEITQAVLPHALWKDPALSRMPGTRPVEGPWIVVDDAYAAQMALRAELWERRRDAVRIVTPGAEPAVAEALEVALAGLPDGFRREGGGVVRPDGLRVGIEGPPFAALNRLVQEDLLILERGAAEHVLTAGLLCFPAHWTLSEKVGRGLLRIHAPVPDYDPDLARRVQRMFDRLPAGRPMWRANVLAHDEARLHRPKPEWAARPERGRARYLRSERQTVLKLPRTGAILFAVHTYLVPLDRLTPAQREGCPVLEEPG
jgi:hypothetical protein